MSNRQYQDRSLAITDHAVRRFRERTGAHHLGDETCRFMIADAVRGGTEQPHYVFGQRVVRVQLMGVEVYAVIGQDKTGWSHSGRAVLTVLTVEQFAQRWSTHS